MSEEKVTPIVLKRSKNKSGDSLRPIVVDYSSRKKKRKESEDAVGGEPKPEYSSNLKDLQEVEGDLVSIARRASESVTKGLDTYDKARKKSARLKKDGAIEDFPHNATKAISAGLKEASEIPVDVVDAVLTRNIRKQIRRNLRRASRTIKIFRI